MNRQIFSRAAAIASTTLILLGSLGWCIIKNPNTAFSRTKPQQAASNIPVNQKLVAANTKFGFKLFSEVLKQDSSKNVFVSPSSVAIALAMTYNGANGETQQAMAKTLELQGMSLQAINEANAALQASLENPASGKGVDSSRPQLTIANSLWAKQGVPFEPEFLQRNRQFYKAKITNLDFTSPNAPAVINNWVKQSTQGKINQIVDTIQADQVLFLINAIYFKGKWETPFNKSQTSNQTFYQLDGTSTKVPMMSQNGKYRYYENNNFQAISIPYSKGRLSFYIFLPKQNATKGNLSQEFNAENWQKWMTNFKMREGYIQLPRFKMDYEIELTNALKTLGMGVAFNSSANFTQMSRIPLNINQVKHKTFVEVNEEGTEAAAVTAIGIVTTSAQIPEEPFRMIVDRPFYCAIRDNQTGTLLFIGSIVEPK